MRNPALSPARRTQNLTEQYQTDTTGRIDKANGIIRGVKILGAESRNGREYSPQALREAARLYEGVRVNLNHPPRSTPGASRDVRDWIGELRKVRLTESGVYGDLYLISSHPHAAAVLEAASRFPTKFGLSHNADGESVSRGGRTIVESISRVRSVDLVTDPATNSSLFEHYQGDSEVSHFKTIRTKAAGIVSSPRLSDRSKVQQLGALLEMDAMADPQTDSVWGAFRAAVLDALDDDALTITQTIAKISAILKSYDKSFGSTVAKPTTTSEAPPAMGAAEMIESYRGTAGRPYRSSSALVEESRRADRQARIQATIRRYR